MNCLKKFSYRFLIIFVAFSLPISLFAQAVGGGISKPISASLGGLISSKVFTKIAQPKNKSKIITGAGKTSTKVSTPVASKTSRPAKSTKNAKVSVPNVSSPVNALTFKPIANTGIAQELAKTLSENEVDQANFILIFKTVKDAYQLEAAKRGRKNDVAMAVTFFIATCLTVYHDAEEPTDEALENVYQTLADSLIEEGNLATSSSLEKQRISETLIYISGLVLAGYLNGKQTNDENSTAIYRQLGGTCLQSLMQTDPDKMRFTEKGLDVN